ncbi:MAG TPA: glycosyltransferase [Polyangia bacterium]
MPSSLLAAAAPSGHEDVADATVELTPAARLEQNLRALARRNPLLAQRLCWPVADGHVVTNIEGRLMLKLHQSHTALELSPSTVAETCRAVIAHQESSLVDGFVFGVGAGELVDELLRCGRVGRVTAWDRDPWMLRLALSRFDFRLALLSGRLRLALGTDLFAEVASLPRYVVHHPVLASVYRNEREIAVEGLRPRCAFIGAGGLFVDDLSDGLRAAGHSVYTVDLERLSMEELEHAVTQVRPAMVMVVNYTEGLGEFCGSHGIPLYCWEVDPTLLRLQTTSAPVDTTRVFTYRRAHVDDFKAAGFPHAEFLPLAANPARRRPATLSETERPGYAVPIAFVGASLVDRVAGLRDDFVRGYVAHHEGCAGSVTEGVKLLDDLLAVQRKDFRQYVVPDLLRARQPGLWAAGKAPGALDLEQVVGELAAGEKRMAFVEALGPLGVHVWGDEGWARGGFQVTYRGPAGHFVELSKIYSAARINVDIGRLYQMDIVTMRVFDVLACGGFLLTERSPALLDLFTPGTHLDVFSGPEELVDKAAYYLAHPEIAAKLAQAGRALVCESHSVSQRLAHMLGSPSKAIARP